ncbi:hypothetical protein [Ktedonospora formicarum]|uniref:hypothetical protein n=1 Tax=Ktedonospora formicarum TaxID=2778364 RepID=UPI001C689C31|nr:hypothetical protein [Ktedonospora formicarum]
MGLAPMTQVRAYARYEQKGGLASCFLAFNNEGHVQIIEFPGNDAPMRVSTLVRRSLVLMPVRLQ